MSIETYYSLLGVSESATAGEIKSAYRELIRQAHPDSVPNASPYWKRAAEEKTQELNEAYAVLSNASKKREYDRLLGEARQSANVPPSPSYTASPQQPTPQAPSAASSGNTAPANAAKKRKGVGELVVLFYVYAIAAGLAFALFRNLWAAVIGLALFGIFYWRTSAKYKRWSLILLVISAVFVVADLLYPDEESAPVRTVQEMQYSNFPCENGQSVSLIDHKPCKSTSKPVPSLNSVSPVEPRKIVPRQMPIATLPKAQPSLTSQRAAEGQQNASIDFAILIWPTYARLNWPTL